MDESQLREYIRQGENLYTEFKASDAHPDDIAAALVAFANTEGGRLIFGVVDNGDIIFFRSFQFRQTTGITPEASAPISRGRKPSL